jgi:hypothetical protein
MAPLRNENAMQRVQNQEETLQSLQSLLDMVKFRSHILMELGSLFRATSEESLFYRPLPSLQINIDKGGFGEPARLISVKPETEAMRNELLPSDAFAPWISYLSNVLIGGCEQLQLAMSKKQVEHMLAIFNSGNVTLGQLCRMMEELGQRLVDELEDKISLQIEAKHADLFENPKAFGEAVFNAFPSANEDIFEASTCLALDRGTACVMHLSRVVEVGLRMTADNLGLPKRHDWGKHLDDIEKELARRYKASGKRTAEEEFLSQSAIHIGHIKVAWRNPSMHVDKQYAPTHAENIFHEISLFMQHLATQLHE